MRTPCISPHIYSSESNTCKDYIDGMMMREVAEKHSVSRSTVRRIIVRNNVSYRHHPAIRDKELDHFFFSEMRKPEVRYFIGLLMADGCVGSDRDTISLSLKIEDKKIIELFLKSINSKKEVRINYRKDGRSCARTAITSKQMVEDLKRHGIIPRKSTREKLLTPSLLYDRDFWRGVIDGDGSLEIYNDKPCLSLYGSKDLLSQFVLFIKATAFNSKANISRVRNTPIWRISIAYKQAAEVVIALYENSFPFIERKNWTAQKIIQFYDNLQRKSKKLTQEEVKQIRELRQKGFLQKDIAKIFNISKGMVSLIITKKAWK